MERIGTYSKLYFPAALALSSDFWRMGVMGAIAASLGQREVGVFNASYRILWITLIFVGSLSGASGIKIAQRLGSGDVDAARQAAAVGVALVFLILLILSSVVFCNIRLCGSLFTNDESYLDLFEECRWPFTCVLFAMNFAVGIETIPISMGQTGNVFYTGFVASWLGQVPGVILLTRFWRHDLYAIYSGVAVGESHYRNNIFASHLGL
jgi:Na+-driven multidrug efflux pump